MNIVPSVAMNEGAERRSVTAPLMRPVTTPAQSARTSAGASGQFQG
jgi:hypothetical protein